MKKFISGLVIGLMISTSLIAFANTTNIIGKQIQGIFPLIINGQKCDKDVIVIDGTSYLPVRKASEIFGYKVDFKNNEVILSNQNESSSEKKAGDKLKHDIYKVQAGFETIEKIECIMKDNEIYVAIGMFNNLQRNHEIGEVIISLPNKPNLTIYLDKIINGEDINGIMYGGRIYIKLSALNLNARIEGDILIIE